MLFILSIVGLYLYWWFEPKLLWNYELDLIYLLFLILLPWIHQIRISLKKQNDTFLFKVRRERFEGALCSKWALGGMVLYFGAALLLCFYPLADDPMDTLFVLRALAIVLPMVHLLLFWKKPSRLTDIAFASALTLLLSDLWGLRVLSDLDAVVPMMRNNGKMWLGIGLLYGAVWVIGELVYKKSHTNVINRAG